MSRNDIQYDVRKALYSANPYLCKCQVLQIISRYTHCLIYRGMEGNLRLYGRLYIALLENSYKSVVQMWIFTKPGGVNSTRPGGCHWGTLRLHLPWFA